MKLILIFSLLLATCLGITLGGRIPIDNPDRTAVTDHDRALIKYYLSGMGGLWAGYMHVFHHGAYALDDKCFKEESAHEVMEILNFLVYGGLSELMLTADAAYALYHDNLKHCGVQESFQSIHKHCTDKPEEAEREINIWFKPDEITNYRLVQEEILYDVNLDGILE